MVSYDIISKIPVSDILKNQLALQNEENMPEDYTSHIGQVKTPNMAEILTMW